MEYNTAMKLNTRSGKGAGKKCQNSIVMMSPGQWEFEILKQGKTLLLFGSGVLKQIGRKVSYDGASFFEGKIEHTHWSGTNRNEGFDFEGNFKGSELDEFEGVITFHDGNARYDLYGFRVN